MALDKLRRAGREPTRPEYPPGQRMHCISEQPERLPNRIGIDTGAYHSGVLTALVLEGFEQRLLQTGGPV